MTQTIRQATKNDAIAIWLLGSQDKQLDVNQFVLQDKRGTNL